MSHICANDEYLSQVGTTNRPENIVIRYVSVVSLSRLFECKVVDVFSFYLQIYRSRLRADISKVTAHERIQYLYKTRSGAGNIFSF
jgi:hypothetical protein